MPESALNAAETAEIGRSERCIPALGVHSGPLNELSGSYPPVGATIFSGLLAEHNEITTSANMRVVTCLSDPSHHGFRHFLEASCRFYGLELETLTHRGDWSSNRLRIAMLQRYLKGLPRSELVLSTDAYDTVLLCSADEIVTKFKRFDREIVFAAEKNCWPHPGLADSYPGASSSFRFLNAGGFLGYAGAISDLLRTYRRPPSKYPLRDTLRWRLTKYVTGRDFHPDSVCSKSDQYYWTHVFLNNQDKMVLDYQAKIFLELSTPLEDLIRELQYFQRDGVKAAIYAREVKRIKRECKLAMGRVVSRSTGEKPCHLHFNGPIVKEVAFQGHLRAAMPWLLKNEGVS